MIKIAEPYPSILLTDNNGEKNGIISDLHLGMEASYLRTADFPSLHSEKTIKKTIDLVKKHNPDKLILLGDIKHSLGRPFREEKQILEYFFWTLDDLNMETVIVKGNHDGGLEKYIENYKYVRIHEETWIKIELENEKFAFLSHGHTKIPQKFLDEANLMVVGHLHPSVKVFLSDGQQSVIRVILKISKRIGNTDKTVIVLPAFGSMGGYVFRYSELARMIPIFRQLDLDCGEAEVIDLARNYLGKLVELQK